MAKTTKKTTAKKATRKKSTATKSAKSATKSPARSKSGAGTQGATRSRKAPAKKSKAGDTEVTVDRRRADRRSKPEATATDQRKLERREKVNRRRQIDPTTCERDYSDEEVEFMNALDNYKRTSGRMFPTCSEVLEVIRKLGYVKVPVGQAASCEGVQETDQQEIEPNEPISPSQDSEVPIGDMEDVFAEEELMV